MSKKSRIRYCEEPGCNKPFMIQKKHKTEKYCPLHRNLKEPQKDERRN
jgi:predicted RNA-binding Zn ribbon-like protein